MSGSESRIQQVLFRLEADYFGNPFYVSGHALFSGIARRVNAATRRALCVSHGVFVPGEHGAYPEVHSRAGGVPFFGAGLRPVEAYDDLFVFRDALHEWLLDSRPRDAHNTQPLHRFGDRVTFGSTRVFGRPPESRYAKRTVTWYVHCYVHVDDSGGRAGVDGSEGGSVEFPLREDVLDGLRVGGGRNFGFGELSLKETRTVDLDAVSFDRLDAAAKDGEAFVVELVSPFVVASEFPGADSQSVPWWWELPGDVAGNGLRRREERVVVGGEAHAVETIDHGQRVLYAGRDPVRTARNGVLRVGTHAKYGFGELRMRPATDVPELARDGQGRGDEGGDASTGEG